MERTPAPPPDDDRTRVTTAAAILAANQDMAAATVISALMGRLGVSEIQVTLEEMWRAPRISVRHDFVADRLIIRHVDRGAPNAD